MQTADEVTSAPFGGTVTLPFRLGSTAFEEKKMNKFVATCLAMAILLTAGCEARTQVAKQKALAQIDSLLGTIDVKRKEIELSVDALKDGLGGLRKAKITAQVKLDQLDRKAKPVEERLSTIDGTLKTLRDHLKSGTVVEIAGRSYSPDELKVMAQQVIAERKGAAEQLNGLRDSQVRLKKVVSTLERKQQDYEQKLSAIENRVAVIDASRIALTALKEAGEAMDGGDQGLARSVEKLEQKVTDLYAEVETELIFEDSKWNDSAGMDTFIAGVQKPADTIDAINKVLSHKP
jgi:chromosome segregation ATPase